MQALSSIFCCLRSRKTRDPELGNGERDPLLPHEPPPVQEIPVEDVQDIIDVDAEGLRERLTFVVVHKRGKMVDVGSTLPFSLSRPSSATRSQGRSASGASHRRSSRPSPLPRQWDARQYYTSHDTADPQPSSPSHSRQPSPTPSMNTHTSPTRSSMYDHGGLDGSLASLAGLPTFSNVNEVDRGSLAERRQSNVHVRILDYGSVARGRRSRSRGGRLASGSTMSSGVHDGEEGKMAVSPVMEGSVEKADEEDDEDSVAGDLGGPDPEHTEQERGHEHDNPRQSSLSRERPSPDLEQLNQMQSAITQTGPLARSWGD